MQAIRPPGFARKTEPQTDTYKQHLSMGNAFLACFNGHVQNDKPTREPVTLSALSAYLERLSRRLVMQIETGEHAAQVR